MHKILFSTLFIFVVVSTIAQETNVFPGADEQSPSRAQYFSWINNCNEGATEEQTLINLEFFKWMKEEYGMQLDIYAFDAGAIDGKRFYGSTTSDRFKKQFPNHFDPMYQKAKAMGTRLGIWGGPDGFGDSPAEEKARIEQMVSLARDYEFELFKFDQVCGPLRKDKEDAFVEMMTKVREYSPNLILLDHRLDLGKGKPHATTFLWEGDETYIDVHMANTTTAPHHRAAALDRGHTPENKRLAEDHGVCLSSCLDYWDDELVMQAFNRNLILAPQIYANPWFLRDYEFAKLARIYNLHGKYKDILVDGKSLPVSTYGTHAMSRGNETTRLLTLTNLSWQTKTVTIRLDEEIGLTKDQTVHLRSYHPQEKIIGNYAFGQMVEVKVLPFRSALFYAGPIIEEDVIVTDLEYQIIKDNKEQKIIDFFEAPDGANSGKLIFSEDFKSYFLNGSETKLGFIRHLGLSLDGKRNREPYHFKLNPMRELSITKDAEALYEATVFSADNNALEVRSIQRSGWSEIPQVRAAQEAFFNQKVFVDKAIWDKNLFDGNLETAFAVNHKWNVEQRVKGGCLRIDLGKVMSLDELKIMVANDFDLQPQLLGEGNWIETSIDLMNWTRSTYIATLESTIPIKERLRYIRIPYAPQRILEIEGYQDEEQINAEDWRASNLFAHASKMEPLKMWGSNLTFNKIHKNAYLCIALEGKHGVEGAYVAATVDGKYYGCPDRAVSYPSNTWEYVNKRRDSNYTYYFPLTEDMVKKKIKIFVMAYDKENLDFTPELYHTSSDPYERTRLVLNKE